MISTTFAAVALSAALSTGAVAVPNWQTDYSKALQTAATEQKPIAVFIGKGDKGFAKVAGGDLPADASELLARNYVCVYVNTETDAGKSLAGKFQISKGLVISGKGGNVQALSYAGSITPMELTGYLTKYSNTKAVSTTETHGGAEAPVAGGCANGQCGSVTVSSGCANGQCSGTTSRGFFRRR